MIKKLLFELKYEIIKNIVLMLFLKAIALYFLASIVFSLMDLTYLAAFFVAALYFFISFFMKFRSMNIKVFEEHNPHMQQMITTAADNMHRDNLVIQELFKDVLNNVKKLSSGTLIRPQQLLMLVLLIPFLAIASYEITPLRIDAISQDAIIDEVNSWGITNLLKGNTAGEIPVDEFLDEDIYGDKKVAELGNQEINLKMNLGYETDFTRPKDEDIDDLSFKEYPDDESQDAQATDTTVNTEHIVETDIAQKYNEKIRNMR